MLTEKHYEQIREELHSCQNPLFFYDDDADGLCAFLLLYRFIREGKGIVNKMHPTLGEESVRYVEENGADKVFVLDVAKLEQSFIDKCPVPVVWIDHHGPFERNNVKLFNPRATKNPTNTPTTFMAYNTAQQDLWIATIGCIADYYMPDFLDEFKKEYPDLINDEKTVGDIYFKSPLSKLIKLFSFSLKGKVADVKKQVQVIAKIQSPYDILEEKTPEGKFLMKHFKRANETYESLLNDARQVEPKGNVILYRYEDNKTSFTGELANEVMYENPDKIIIIARRKDDKIRMSLRSSSIDIPDKLQEAMNGLDGYGGGHERACGANVSVDDFETFIERFSQLT